MKNSLVVFSIVFLSMVLTNSFGQTISNFTTENGLPHNNVNGIAIDSENRAWLGTQEGVAVYDQGNWTYYTSFDGLIFDAINCITVDDGDNVWIGTDFGVSTWNGNLWTSYTTQDGLGNNWVYSINTDEDGNTWFGTITGLSKLDTEGTWTTWGMADGLWSGVCDIGFDSQGNKWLGTFTAGMVKFDDQEFISFTTDDGMLNDFNILSIAIDDQDHKWVATPMGISHFDKNDLWLNNII